MKTALKYRYRDIFLYVLPIISLIWLTIIPAGKIFAQEDVQKNQMKFGRLLRLIDGFYVDSADVNKLTEQAIVHMLS